MTQSQTAGAAMVRLSRNEAAAVILGRAILISELLAAATTLKGRVRHRTVLLAGVGGLVGHALWAGQRVWRTMQVNDRVAGWSDVGACLAALSVEAASWGTRDLPPDPRWSLPIAVAVSAWLPFELGPRDLAGAGVGWAATYLASTRNRSTRSIGTVQGQRMGELFSAPTCALVCRRFATELRRQAHQLDEARAEAVRLADRLARQEESSRQFRVTHDSAIQVLEAVAGGWEVDPDTLAARIDFEIGRLLRVLKDGGLIEAGSLGEGISSLVEEFAVMGLHVVADTSGLTLPCSPGTSRALCEAAHEALVNVKKHARVPHATLAAADADDGFEVVVADEGRGFDPGATRSGFGIAESIVSRMASVGGTASVSSHAGTGTTVTLWGPAVPSERRHE